MTLNEEDLDTTNSGCYYTKEELIALGIILPVKMVNVEQADGSTSTTPEDGIIIFPNRLPLHKGLVNNFSEYPLTNVLLCYIPEQNVLQAESG